MKPLLKALLLGSLVSILLLAQTATPTHITGTLTNPDGSNFNGTLQISWPSYYIGQISHPAGSMAAVVSNGVMNLSLYPTDAMTPSGITYAVTLQAPGQPTVTANWSIPTSASAVNITSLYTPPGTGSGSNTTTRTWSFAAQGVCQSALAGAAIWLPASNAPAFNSCSGTAQQGEWTVAASNASASWGLQFVVPAGTTGTWALALTWRTADTTTAHALVLQPSYSCVAAGSSPDNPSYTNLSTITLNPGTVASVNATATLSFTPACSAGSQFRLLLASSSNTFSAAAQFSVESVAMQAGN